MAEDWAIDVRKYAPDADDKVIAGIVRYCGIALTKRDSSLVSFTDPKETGRVRDNFCRKKLGLTDPDSDIDAAIARVGERMSGDTTRNRVTVYYLLAERFGKLGVFSGKAKAAGGAAAASLAAATAVGAAGMAAAPAVAAAPPPPAPAPMTAMASPEPGQRRAAAAAIPQDGGGFLGFGAAVFGGLVTLVLGTMLLGQYIGSRGDAPAVPAAPAPLAVAAAPAPVVAAPAIPDGAGVIGETVAGLPKVSVYFDTGSKAVTPDFAAAAAPVKAWIDANPGARLAVSGFNDPTGNAAANAELSKNRAQEVAAALAAIGVPADRIDLVKPEETTATDADMAQARRVEITVVDAAAE